jgi:hypothetical protein
MNTWLITLGRQTYKAQPLGELAIEYLKRHKSPGIYQIIAEPIK